MINSPTLISILGPTSSGKTSLSIHVAHFLQSQGIFVVIVNCDSRQIYKGLDISSGKIEGMWSQHPDFNQEVYVASGIPHLLIDYVDPQMRYSQHDYLLAWSKLFTQPLWNREPDMILLVGGTGYWAEAIIQHTQLETISAGNEMQSQNLKDSLAAQSLTELQASYNELVTHNQLARSPLNESDYYNPRRLANAVWRSHATMNKWFQITSLPQFDHTLNTWIFPEINSLETMITARMKQRLKDGLEEEILNLNLGMRNLELGLEQRITYLKYLGMIPESEYEYLLIQSNKKYAKRQITWFQKQTYLQKVKAGDAYHCIISCISN